MRLNHLDVHVPDVVRTAALFVSVFGLRERFSRPGFVILNDDDGFELVISEPVLGFGTSDQVALGASTYHMGFIVESAKEVDDIFLKLQSADVQLKRPPQAIRGGWLFYCTVPGNIQIEVGCRQAAA